MDEVNAQRRRALATMLALPAITWSPGARAASDAPPGSPAPSVARVNLPAFSANSPGRSLPAGWAHQTLPGVERANRFDLIAAQGTTVLQVLSEQSASSLVCAQRVDPAATPLLAWRWWVSHPVAGSDLRHKAGDDYAARVYVLFDLPLARLSAADRVRLATARLLHGAVLPAAALCYVWGNAQAAGASGWNAYTDRVRMHVVDSGNARAGQWRNAVRDVAADFTAAFGGPVPPITAVALSADTDNTGERVETRFGDLFFLARS